MQFVQKNGKTKKKNNRDLHSGRRNSVACLSLKKCDENIAGAHDARKHIEIPFFGVVKCSCLSKGCGCIDFSFPSPQVEVLYVDIFVWRRLALAPEEEAFLGGHLLDGDVLDGETEDDGPDHT